MAEIDEKKISVVVRSIGSGEFKRTPSWSDINSLIDRIETLEQERQQREDDEHAHLINGNDDVADIDDFKENTAPLPKLKRRASKAQSQRRGTVDRLRGMAQIGKFGKTSLAELEEVENKYDHFEIPKSTFTFFITEPIFSTPFLMGCLTYGMCLTCLILALLNELDNGTDDNPHGIVEVTMNVRATQFFGIIIGVLMDDEIPTGLELIGKALEQKTDHGSHYLSKSRIVISSILRISIGAMFLCCLFFVVIQENNVLDIFFDVLALEFVENIDDVVFELCRRGFFSRRLKIAANKEHVIVCSSSDKARRLRKWSKRFIRAFYLSVMIGMMVGLSYITIQQPTGEYGCTSIIIQFGDEVWEKAWVTLPDQKCSVDSDCSKDNQKCFEGKCHENRLLIFSHFNGLYVFNGTVAERPRYVEMNKEKGIPYQKTIPAEIIYCEDIESWVFFHPNIKTSLDSQASNECQWLLRSEQTEDFDLVELSTGFYK